MNKRHGEGRGEISGLKEFQAYFNPLFAEFLRDKLAVLPQIPYFKELSEHILRLAGSGKRLRPFVALIGYAEGGGERGRALSLFCALECFHLFALIHDDIIDLAKERRGVPSLHETFGEPQAILAGDMCLAWAYEAIGEYHKISRVMEVFGKMAQETGAGQMLESALTSGQPLSEDLLDAVVDMKTARYTFTYPLAMGRLLAGRSENEEAYSRFCAYLGSAFQRLDNMADVFWTKEQLGKEPAADVRQGVPNHLSFYIFNRATDADKKLFSEWWGKGSDLDVGALQDMLRRCGAFGAEKISVAENLKNAEKILQTLEIPADARNAWRSCLDLLQAKLSALG